MTLAMIDIALIVDVSKMERCNSTCLPEETPYTIKEMFQIVCEMYNESINDLMMRHCCWFLILVACIVLTLAGLLLVQSRTKTTQLY